MKSIMNHEYANMQKCLHCSSHNTDTCILAKRYQFTRSYILVPARSDGAYSANFTSMLGTC